MIGWIVDGPPLVLVIDAKLPHKTLAELVADAKANPNKYSFGTSGPASSPGLTLAQLNSTAKTEIVAVPYRGSGEAARAVAGGAIQGAFTFYSQAKPLVDDGQVRAIAVASSKRLEAWPDVPTFIEQGYKIDQRGFVGLAAPAKTPKPVIEFLNKHLNEVVQTDAFKKRMAELGMTAPPAADNTPEKFDAFMRQEIARQGDYAELSGQKLAAAEVRRKNSGGSIPWQLDGLSRLTAWQSRLLDGRRPHLQLARHPVAHFFRRAGGGLAAHGAEAGAHLRQGDGLADLGVEPFEDRLGHAGGRRHRKPAPHIVVRSAERLIDRRHVRQGGVARVGRDRERAELAGLDVLDGLRRRHERELDLAGEQRRDDGRVAAIRHVQELGAGAAAEQFDAQMMRRARTGAAERDRSRRGLRLGDDIGEGFELRIRRHHDEERHRDDVGNPVEAVDRVERQRLEHRPEDGVAAGRDQKRVAVRRAACGLGGAERTGRARLVLDHQRLAEVLSTSPARRCARRRRCRRPGESRPPP